VWPWWQREALGQESAGKKLLKSLPQAVIQAILMYSIDVGFAVPHFAIFGTGEINKRRAQSLL
jgi:hypothetical protein